MSQTATRPWWADVQHLRPDEAAGDERTARTGRFDRPAAPSRRASHDERQTRVASRADAAEPRRRERPSPAEPKPQRRTIEIRGQVDRVHGVAPISSPGPQRIRGRRADERVGPRPDKVALWAVLLGLLLILVAAMSSPGADAAVLLAGRL
ncbi:MAG TPA: hypothetical protein VGW10_09460 [Solirubrobacteraceae bacterium]|nr:hypothetical protein [Solirubrobacteraceae bacterium]